MNGGLSQYARMLDASARTQPTAILPPPVLNTPYECVRQDRRYDGSLCSFGSLHHSAASYYEDDLSDETIAAIARWSEAIRWAAIIICGVLVPVIFTCIAAT